MPDLCVGFHYLDDSAFPTQTLWWSHLQRSRVLLYDLRGVVAEILTIEMDGTGDLGDCCHRPLLSHLVPLSLHCGHHLGAGNSVDGLRYVQWTGAIGA